MVEVKITKEEMIAIFNDHLGEIVSLSGKMDNQVNNNIYPRLNRACHRKVEGTEETGAIADCLLIIEKYRELNTKLNNEIDRITELLK